jgi:hypothetical protein
MLSSLDIFCSACDALVGGVSKPFLFDPRSADCNYPLANAGDEVRPKAFSNGFGTVCDSSHAKSPRQRGTVGALGALTIHATNAQPEFNPDGLSQEALAVIAEPFPEDGYVLFVGTIVRNGGGSHPSDLTETHHGVLA